MVIEKVSLSLDTSTGSSNYQIVIGYDIFSKLNEFLDLNCYSHLFFLIDAAVATAAEPIIKTLAHPSISIQQITAGEQYKNWSTLEKLLTQLQAARLDRKSLLVNVGGGMIGDFGGFAASIYMRGIDFIQVPTILLSQVDASVGGKVAVNFGGIKNLIGSFQQPKIVLIDTSFLNSLPQREIISGFAEIIKHAAIADLNFFKQLETYNLNTISQEQMIAIVKRNCEIKASIVERDPHEKNIRKTLNFGHTIGHAIEALMAETKSPLLHGECIALGMIAEASVAVNRNLLKQSAYEQLLALLVAYKLPQTLPVKLPEDSLIERMKQDKKNTSGIISLALLEGLGSCLPSVEVSAAEIALALQSIEAK